MQVNKRSRARHSHIKGRNQSVRVRFVNQESFLRGTYPYSFRTIEKRVNTKRGVLQSKSLWSIFLVKKNMLLIKIYVAAIPTR